MPSDENAGTQFLTATLSFIVTELEVAETFAGIALESDNREKILRNTKNARTGYETILRFLDIIPLEMRKQKYIAQRLTSLKLKLVELGEDV